MRLATVSVLGPVEARSADGERLELGPLRHHALLATLALRANGPVAAETLIDSIWAGTPPASARSLLHTYICRLRRIIDPDSGRWDRRGLLARSGAGYLLALPHGFLDLHHFDRLVALARDRERAGDLTAARELLGEASRLWRGDAMQGVFSPTIDSHRRWLAERRLLVAKDRLALDLALGGHQAAVPELLTLSTEHPLQEDLVALLMLTLYRSGRQSEALHAYAAVRDRLAEELGVEPGPKLRDLYVKVLRTDPDLDRPLLTPPVRPRDAKPQCDRGAAANLLLGRIYQQRGDTAQAWDSYQRAWDAINSDLELVND